jgi:two-component system, LytTR family, sensor kinase
MQARLTFVRIARQYAIAFAIWTALGLLLIYQLYQNAIAQGRPFTFLMSVMHPMVRYWTLALLTPPIHWLCSRYPFQRGNIRKSIVAQLIGFVVSSAVYAYLRTAEMHVLPNQYSEIRYKTFLSSIFKGLLSEQVWMYGGIVLASYTIHYYFDARRRELDEERVRAELAQAQLQILKLQLHPHFLFNTLNGISALMSTDVRLARSMMAELSDLFRLALKNTGAHEIPLKQELAFIKGYLRLQKMRLGNRLDCTIDVPDELLDVPVPSMVLQPIVENAIRHGIERIEDGGKLEIRVGTANGKLQMIVSNDGSPVEEDGRPGGTGVGLQNTRDRLRQFYGSSQRLEIAGRHGGGVQVTLELPGDKSTALAEGPFLRSPDHVDAL